MSNQIANSDSRYGSASPHYAGNVTVQEAWAILEKNKDAILIDVRTNEEWKQVGVPSLSSLHKNPLFISWREYPAMQLNTSFVPTLVDEVADKKTTLLFICRSGGRSAEAAQAMTQIGYVNCYNVDGGVEGIMNRDHHIEYREHINTGWKAAKLPWEQK